MWMDSARMSRRNGGNGRGTGRGRARARRMRGHVRGSGRGARRRVEADRGLRGRAERPQPGRSPRPTVPELSEPRARARRTAFGASRENTRAGWRNDAHPDVCVCVDWDVSSAVGCAPRVDGSRTHRTPRTDDAKGIEIRCGKTIGDAESPIHVGDFLQPDPPTFARALNPFSRDVPALTRRAVRPPAPPRSRQPPE